MTRLNLNRQGIRTILRSERVRADLHRRAQQIADAAGEGHRVESDIGRVRARAAVVTDTPEAMLSEALDRTLTRAVDAGRA